MPEPPEQVEPCCRCGRPAERPVIGCGHVVGRDEERLPLCIDAMLTAMAYHRVGNRPGRWEPRAETTAEAGRPPDATTSHRQTAAQSWEMVVS
jgi:hypothetical protein